jgi:hypothetical protein
MQRVILARLVGSKNYQATPRAVNAPLDLATQLQDLRHAMLYLRVPTVGTVQFVNVKQVIFAPVKPLIKPLAYRDSTPPKKDLLHASNAPQASTRNRKAQAIANHAEGQHFKMNPTPAAVFQYDLDTTAQGPPQKSFVQLANRAKVALPNAKVAWQGGIKISLVR